MRYFLVPFVLSIIACPIQGQTISLFREFTTPAIDRAAAVAADGSGVYVAGFRRASQDTRGGPASESTTPAAMSCGLAKS
jgi:hypothetical protein